MEGDTQRQLQGCVPEGAVIREVRGVVGVTVVRDGLKVGATGNFLLVQDPATSAPVAPYPLAPQGGPPPLGGGNPIVEPAPLGVPGQFSPEMGAPNCRRTPGRPTLLTTTSAASATRPRTRTTPSRSSARSTRSRRFRSAGGKSPSNGKTATGTWAVTPPRRRTTGRAILVIGNNFGR